MSARNDIQKIQKILGFTGRLVDGIPGDLTEGRWIALKAAALAEICPAAGEPTEPAWLRVARAELGTAEITGERDNPRIVEYHAATSLSATDDETPWCASFVNWCLARGGSRGTGSAMARSFLNWGREVTDPQPGTIVVFKRGAAPKGHVAFLLSRDASNVTVLGGNQGNRVSIQKSSRASVLGYRWPK